MPRQARLDIPGLVYHVIARGIERGHIFRDAKDRESFLARLGELVVSSEARLYAWCLLDNHFHLLLRRGEEPLSWIMRRLMTGHAVRYNRRHDRAGHLFQNRYKSIVVEEEPYFLQVVRYIHLNPVRAGLVATAKELEEYPFSGHSVLVGRRKAEWQDTESVLERFGRRKADAIEGYREFVAAVWDEGHREEFGGGGLVRSAGGRDRLKGRRFEERESADERILGAGDFVEEVWRAAEGAEGSGVKRPLEAVLQEVSEKWGLSPDLIAGASRERRISRARREFLLRAYEETGANMTALGRRCGIGHASVRAAIAKARSEVCGQI